MRLTARAGMMLLAFHHIGDHDAQEILKIALAALEYGDSDHTLDANHYAGDCDSCTAREALKKLEALVLGPELIR
jgi:hypothetical protein